MGPMADQAGQSDPGSHPNAHAGEALSGSHASMDDHGGDHGHDDHNMGEGHEAEALGPVDVTMWGAAVLGVALGLVVFLAVIQALS
jgi:hypothetical protein